VQDGDYVHDCHLPPYVGKFDWAKIMKALKAMGYKGDLTLEIPHFLHHLPDEVVPEALAFVHKVGSLLVKMFDEA
jgi:sugar phosphate isomerase/epimerase